MRLRKHGLLVFITILLAIVTCAPAYAFTPTDYNSATPQQLTPDMLYSQAAVLIDADSGDILFSKNERERMNPASTTKVMTLLLALESGIPLNQEIAIPQAAADVPGDSSLVPVYPGETMTFGALLQGLMLHSGNDGANAIAVLVAGSVDNFVNMMNQRAAQIGCTGTHFANPHGYTDENHYTTAYDLAMITRVGLENPVFRQIVGSPTATIMVNERGQLNLVSKHEMLKPNSLYYYEGAIGVKTGTTNAAGVCYIGAAEKDGATLVSVVLKSEKTEEEELRWIDTARLFDFGWTCYDTYALDQMFRAYRSQKGQLVVSNASHDDPYAGVLEIELAQISDTGYIRMVERGNENALAAAVTDFDSRAQIQLYGELVAPISKGEILGDFKYIDSSTNTMVTAKVVAGRDIAEHVEPPKVTDYFPILKIFSNRLFLVLLGVLVLLIVLIFLLAANRRAQQQRRRRMIYERRRQQMEQRPQRASDRYDRGYDTRRRSYSRDEYDDYDRRSYYSDRRPASRDDYRRSSGSRSTSSRSSYDRRRPR